MSDLLRNTLSQLSLGAVDALSNEAIGATLGLPPGTMTIVTGAKGLLKGAAQTAVLKVYDDIYQRQISKIEESKVKQTFEKAENVFWEFVEKEGVENVGYGFPVNSPEYRGALETAEGFLMQSMKEFERKKLDILACFYGRNLYYGNAQWESIHQTLRMLDRLTYRQIVLIRLICEQFNGINPEYCITAPDGCVETMDLLNYGVWTTPGAFLSQDNSSPITVNVLKPTNYARQLYVEMMLERIPSSEMQHVIATLRIEHSDKANQVLTIEDKESIFDSITWHEEELSNKADADQGTF